MIERVLELAVIRSDSIVWQFVYLFLFFFLRKTNNIERRELNYIVSTHILTEIIFIA